jgi:hypothetical protein
MEQRLAALLLVEGAHFEQCIYRCTHASSEQLNTVQWLETITPLVTRKLGMKQFASNSTTKSNKPVVCVAFFTLTISRTRSRSMLNIPRKILYERSGTSRPRFRAGLCYTQLVPEV